MRAADADALSLPDGLVEPVRVRLGMTGRPVDVLVPLEDMVTAIGDALPLATLSVMLDRYSPGAVMALRTDGRLDVVSDGQAARLAA